MQRKRIRLPRDAYEAPGVAWLVTIGVADRAKRPFADPALAGPVLRSIVRACSMYRTTLHLAILMPDHAHLVIEVTDDNLVDVVRRLKSLTTQVAWSNGLGGTLWQKSFHDRGLRDAAVFEEAITYLLNNPVRAGLATMWEDYPYVAGAAIDEPPS